MDRDAAEFAWPQQHDPLYADLAAFLARLNELSLDEVLGMERANGRSATHELEVADGALSAEAEQRWEHVYSTRRLDETENADLAIVTISYCLGYGDGRRVVVAFNREGRRMFPLWWDPEHKVSGSDGVTRDAGDCIEQCLHNRPA